MKILVLLVALAALGYWAHGFLVRRQADEKTRQANAAERYAVTLHAQEQHAQAAAAQANALIQSQEKDVQAATQGQ